MFPLDDVLTIYKCAVCGRTMEFIGGKMKCPYCGWSPDPRR